MDSIDWNFQVSPIELKLDNFSFSLWNFYLNPVLDDAPHLLRGHQLFLFLSYFRQFFIQSTPSQSVKVVGPPCNFVIVLFRIIIEHGLLHFNLLKF